MAGFKFIYGCVTIHVMSGSRERFINMPPQKNMS